MSEILVRALSYLESGLSVLPIKLDGSKSPACQSWKSFMTKHTTEDEARIWWDHTNPPGIAVVLGTVSGGLHALDYDLPGFFEAWVQRIMEADEALLSRLPIVRTPSGGRHVYFRQGKSMARKILASNRNREVAIELRGEGNYVLVPGCPANCHEAKREYVLETEGLPIEKAPILESDEVETLLEAARGLNEHVAYIVDGTGVEKEGWKRPGTAFNEQAKWLDVLEPHGWTVAGKGRENEETLLRRPGKDRGEIGRAHV